MKDTQSDPLATMTSPDVSRLIKELALCTPYQNTAQGLATLDDIRFNRWPGQAEDGKKHDAPGRPAFPWDGASDGQPMLADAVVIERVSLLTSAFWRAAVKAKAADDEASNYAVKLVSHWLNEALIGRLFQEVALSANHLEHYGVVVLHTCWERQLALRRVRVTVQDLMQVAQALTQEHPEWGLENLPTAIGDPEQEDNGIALLQAMYSALARQAVVGMEIKEPELKASTARKAIRSLRETGAAEVPLPYVCRNEPAVYALRIGDEIWMPNDTTDLACARILFHREWFTQAELRAKVADGWNAAWIEAAVKTAGHSVDAAESQMSLGRRGKLGSDQATPFADLVEVFHATYKAVDEDGVLGVYQTTFSAHIPQPKGDGEKSLYASTELVSYAHGAYPYIGGKSEHWCRQFLASRGVPETVKTWQQQAKGMDDAVMDYLSIGVLPPVNVPHSPLGTKYRFGPAVQNPITPGKEPQFMAVPPSGVQMALSARQQLQARVDNYFGLMSADVPPARWQQVQAGKAMSFLLMWSSALQQMVALAQQYMPDSEFSRVTGAPVGWLDARRDRIGAMAVTLSFDVRELDSEMVTAQMKAINEVILPADVQGTVDRNKLVATMMRAVNPQMAQELIMPAPAASEALWRQVRDDIGQMALGNEAKYVENDPTAQTKLQFAQQIVQGNPQYQAQLAQPTRFAELFQKYVANLQFSTQQQQNRQIGRIGVTPQGGAA